MLQLSTLSTIRIIHPMSKCFMIHKLHNMFSEKIIGHQNPCTCRKSLDSIDYRGLFQLFLFHVGKCLVDGVAM